MGGTVMEDCFLLPPSSFSSSWSNLSKRREAREVRLLIKPGQVQGLLTCLLITPVAGHPRSKKMIPQIDCWSDCQKIESLLMSGVMSLVH